MLDVLYALDVVHQGMKFVCRSIERAEKDSVSLGIEVKEPVRLMLLLPPASLRVKPPGSISNYFLVLWWELLGFTKSEPSILGEV